MKPTLPNKPGVYIFKDTNNHILYIGKAASLRNRVRSYFQNNTDWKVKALLDEHDRLDFICTKNDTEALLLEAQMIKQHQPKYNVLLKSGQPFLYILFTKEQLPRMLLVRNKKLKGTYFGPFLHKNQARGAHRYLLHTFQLRLCNKKIPNGCLHYHIGTCAGTCKNSFDQSDYLFRLQLAQEALTNNHKVFLHNIEEKIKQYTAKLEYEKAKQLAIYLRDFDTIFTTIRTRYTETKFSKQLFAVTTETKTPERFKAAGSELQQLLGTDTPIITIDCFDISHFQSRSIVGSCVRFTNGIPDKDKFRRFKIRTLTQQNDYAGLQEIVTRRYKKQDEIPDLILIDGGKGQLNAVKQIIPGALVVSLAKQNERLFGTRFLDGVPLDIQTPVGQLLIALRDYTHHFAITYHRKRQSLAMQRRSRT